MALFRSDVPDRTGWPGISDQTKPFRSCARKFSNLFQPISSASARMKRSKLVDEQTGQLRTFETAIDVRSCPAAIQNCTRLGSANSLWGRPPPGSKFGDHTWPQALQRRRTPDSSKSSTCTLLSWLWFKPRGYCCVLGSLNTPPVDWRSPQAAPLCEPIGRTTP